MKTFPTPDLLSEGSRWDHMMRIGRPFIMSKFMVSRARSAEKGEDESGEWHNLTDGTYGIGFGRLTVCRLLEVDVGVSQGAAAGDVAADPDGQHWTGRGELVEEHGLVDVIV